MSQNDFVLANQDFPSMRTDMNSALQALVSNSSGTTEPATTYAYQMWYDETTDILKMRNAGNDGWISLAEFDQTSDVWHIIKRTSATGSALLPVGTTAQRDGSPAAGYIRLNSSTGLFEGYTGSTWLPFTGQIVRETEVATSGAAEYGFTSIPAGVGRVTLSFTGVSLAGTDDILIQIGDSGGYETSGYAGGSVLSASSGNDVFSSASGFAVNTANSAANAFSGNVFLVRSSGNKWTASGNLWGATISAMSTVAGDKTLSAELDRLRIISSVSDNFDAGTLNILYEVG